MKQTDTYKKVLDYLYIFQKTRGYSPSIKEIKEAVGLKSLRGVSLQLDKLQKLNLIERTKGTRRAIKILYRPIKKGFEETVKIPLVGKVRAGSPILAQENIEEYKEIPRHLLHGRQKAFLLRVEGDSMNKAGFLSGDLAIVLQQNYADNGDIVVAFIPEDQTATLKRFKKMSDYILLLPESDNPSNKAIIEKSVSIQGKVLDKLPENL